MIYFLLYKILKTTVVVLKIKVFWDSCLNGPITSTHLYNFFKNLKIQIFHCPNCRFLRGNFFYCTKSKLDVLKVSSPASKTNKTWKENSWTWAPHGVTSISCSLNSHFCVSCPDLSLVNNWFLLVLLILECHCLLWKESMWDFLQIEHDSCNRKLLWY